MALFTINRYMGDEDGEADNDKHENKAQSILEKIHLQAIARRSLSTPPKAIGSQSAKKRTRKDSTESTTSSSEDEIPDNLQTSKRKRLKGKDSDDESDVEQTPSKKAKSSPLKTKKTPQEKKKIRNVPDGETEEGTTPSKKNKKTPKTPDVPSRKKVKGEEGSESEEEEAQSVTPNKQSKKEKRRLTSTTTEAEEENEVVNKEKSHKGEDDVSGEEGEGNEEDGEREEEEEEDVDNGQQNREVGGFTVIGDVRKKKIEQVQRVLPDWLANPSVINNNLRDDSDGLGVVSGLDAHLIKMISDNGIKHLFPVQRLVIPVLLAGNQTGHMIGSAGYRPCDICCSAPTGSGKTLAFVLPIVQSLRCRVVREVRALVVLPVRDLATQVYKVFCAYTKDTDLKVGLLSGQKTFKNEQRNLIKRGPRGLQVQADIIVATPGRLVDHIKDTPGFNLHHLRYLVIDEADRMMDDIKQDWLSQVEQAVYGGDSPRQRPAPLSVATACKMEMPLQKLLFSATLSQNPEKLQQLNLFQPRLFTAVVEAPRTRAGTDADNTGENKPDSTTPSKTKGEFVGKFTTPSGLTEYMVMARDAGEKPLLVLHFLLQLKFRHVLVFANSVESTHRLYQLIKLVGGIEVQEFSSNLHALQRNRILKKFAAGKIEVLICSDAMARGMDVENVQCVLSYDHAPYVKTYIHRIGRTARAGKVGTAITLLEKKEVFNFKKMVREAGKEKVRELKISKGQLRGLLPRYQEALTELPGVLEKEKKNH